MTARTLPTYSTHSPLWRSAALVGLALTAVLLLGLAVRPTLTLHVLWDMVIPLLPLVFLVNPMIWRNVCPLATLNTLTGVRADRRVPSRGVLQSGWLVGIVLLAILVPARRFLFNENGTALLVTIAAVAALAIMLGLVFSRRSGFCNALCPVLPVEKLYGQAPLLRIPTARCGECTVCSASGCLDLAGGKSLAQSLGPARRSTGWFRSPLGLFAAAFPGFIVGYFTSVNGPLSSAPAVYGHIGLWTLASLATVLAVVMLFGIGWRVALPILGGTALAAYYWFSAPAIAEAYNLSTTWGAILRVATLAATATWLVRALRQGRTGTPASRLARARPTGPS
ncbi:MAG TPA: hypothetical protein PL091_08955 [Actinomycetota bacterium]|nr:hypothetical protein [Actinomycetota bacterium]